MRADFLCDLTGNAARPFARAGYDCVCYDIQHSIRADRVERVGRGTITYRWADIRSLTASDLRGSMFGAAFTPCTHLAVSGARDFARKGLRLLIDALELVEHARMLLDGLGVPYYLENPVGRLSTCWRKPDFLFNPCDYAGWLPPGPERAAEAYTKKTCLWTGGGFVMPEPRPVPPVLGSKMHLLPPGAERANLRSATPMGFAEAVFQANRCDALNRVEAA